jgi:hypothetical protein
MLRAETARMLGDWIYEDILCQWGSLREIVTDNSPAFLKAMEYLSKRYHINHIWISSYNSQANGTVECSHFDVCQSLFKVVDGDQKQWSLGIYSVFWAERVTPRERMGCSPYFAVTGAHPILPFDIAEATYLQPPPTSVMSLTDSYPTEPSLCRNAQLMSMHSTPKSTKSGSERHIGLSSSTFTLSKTSTSSMVAWSSCAIPR